LQASDFSKDAPGRLVKTVEDQWAFVPAPLPPALDFDGPLVKVLSAADQALGRLAGAAHNIPNPHLLIRPFIRREAVLSSRIEGTLTTLAQLLESEATQKPNTAQGDLREVMNYVHALEFALKQTELPMSLRLIRQTHGRLMHGVRGKNQTPGEFRRHQNYLGPPGCALRDARFVPPPPPEMQQALHTFEGFLHEPNDLPPLVRLALIHYQFESIHPFGDGNGRIGRLLVSLLICAESLLPNPLLYLSAYFDRERDAYYERLLHVSTAGAWNKWIAFFLNGVREQAEDAVLRSSRLLKLRDRFHTDCHTARSSALLHKLVDRLFSQPFVTISDAAELLDVTPRAAQLNIEKLMARGMLEEVTGRQRNRLYLAAEVLRAVEESPVAAGVQVST